MIGHTANLRYASAAGISRVYYHQCLSTCFEHSGIQRSYRMPELANLQERAAQTITHWRARFLAGQWSDRAWDTTLALVFHLQ